MFSGDVMKKLATAIAAIALIGTPAFAADMAVKVPSPAPIPAPVYSWTGFYVGGNVGYGLGNSNNTNNSDSPCPICLVAPLPNFATLQASGSNHPDGVIGGGQVGYNWQFTNYLFGIEADMQASGQKGTNTTNNAFFLPIAFFGGAMIPSPVTLTNTTRLDWFGTVRGRIGYVVDRWLVYGTGGLAYGQLNVSSSVVPTTIAAAFPNTPYSVSSSETKVGWVVGAGVEESFSPSWSWKVEYLYMDLGNVTATGAVPAQGCLGNNLACNPTAAGGTARYTAGLTDNIVRVGLNYQFH
jgi:outer membrane immunogenic protein